MKRFCAMLAASSLLAAPIVVALQMPAHAACAVFARTPTVNSTYDTVIASGGRSGCGSAKQILVELKLNQVLYPDKVLAYKSGTYTNVTLRPEARCRDGSHEYFTQVGGAAGSAASGRKRVTGENC